MIAQTLSTPVTDGNMEQGHDKILQKKWVIINEVAHQLQISHCLAYKIIHSRLAIE
jgi:hypothetical protein